MKPIAAISILGIVASSVLGQSLPFPMTASSHSPHEILLAPSIAAFRHLAAMERVTLTGVPVPGKPSVSLQLRRTRLHLGSNAIHVDGVAGHRGPTEDTSFWSGTVEGQASSQAFLAFSKHGSRGWFGTPGKFVHMLAQPGPNKSWSTSRSRLVTDYYLATTGYRPRLDCNLVQPPIAPIQPNASSRRSAGAGPFIDAPIAFETDFEFFQLFNNLAAAKTYAFTLLGAVSDRYRQQMDVIFTLPYVGFYTSNNDPWTKNICSDRLSQFRSKWRSGRAPVPAQLYHMVSGVKVTGCGGVAYLNVICNQNYGFGMSAHINANTPFPPAQGPLTWDFMVIAHETGHQFGSNHTHSYSPPIDNCATKNPCISNGTNMSYCHTCPGGMNNMTLMFHPRVVTVIKREVSRSCLKKFDGVIAKDLGHALLGSNGIPTQDLSYSSPTLTIDVEKAPKSQPGFLFFGLIRIDFPLAGGTIVPNPRAALALISDPLGKFQLSAPIVPSFPGGLTFYLQTWFLDPTGPNPLAATNATHVELIKP
ncbi:MAG: M12 family metallo-peptidase [Planctomycetota bacterium]|nr:M12 family metallo-peptidase [Planctomycetota bacterium]